MSARKPEIPVPSPWLTLGEGASYARMSVAEFGDLLRSGEIVGRQSGNKRNGRWRVNREAIDAYLNGVPYVPVVPFVARRKPAGG